MVSLNPLTRRRFVGLAAAASVAAPRSLFAKEKQTATLFVGNGGVEGIFAASWNAETGEIGPLELAAACAQPGFLALNSTGDRLYATGNSKAAIGSLSAYEREGRRLRLLNQVSSGGQNPCHIAVWSGAGRKGWAFAANYGNGHWEAARIGAQGELLAAATAEILQGSGPMKGRQQSSHTHWTTVAPNGRFVYVNDLGSDRIWLHRLDEAGPVLLAEQSYVARAGSGPRTLHFHPQLPIAYAVCELDSSIDLLNWSAETGALVWLETYSLLPEGKKGSGCDLVLTRDGLHAYAIERGENFVAIYSADDRNGRLQLIERVDCGGKTPRHLALDPSEKWLLIANQDSGNVAVLPRDVKTGRLGRVARTVETALPMCLLFG